MTFIKRQPPWPRADLVQEDLAVYEIPLGSARITTGAILGTSQVIGNFNLKSLTGGASDQDMWIESYAANNDTQISKMSLEGFLHPNYVDGQSVSVRIGAYHDAGGTAGTCTIDILAFLMPLSGDEGTDICTTAAQTISGTATDYDFELNHASLVRGSRIKIIVDLSVQETAAAGDLKGRVSHVAMLSDIKG